eukprot:497336_1
MYYYTSVYQWNGSWTQLGDDIQGETQYESWWGSMDFETLSLNNDGTILAVGVPTAQFTVGDAPRVFEYDSNYNEWQMIYEVSGEKSNDRYGCSVSLSGAGKRLAFGTKGENEAAYVVHVVENEAAYDLD